jgi:D-glycero-D-manno-heptose 1,7-bisphosphate phosphatase
VLANQQHRAVFLDRDGVINRSRVINGKPYPPLNLTTMEILPGVAQALESLSNEGFLLIVITNQPDVARGTTSRATVEAINTYLAKRLPIDDIRTCFHDNQDGCDCRKPSPGALLAAAKQYRVDLSQSYMVGDRWSDVEAGQRAGCQTIFIDYGYAEQQPSTMNYAVQNLLEASKIILDLFRRQK